MSNSGVELRSLSLFERKEYEELKQYYTYESRKLRQQRAFIGLAVVSMIGTMAAFHFFG
jgi:hypothetical protein